MRVISSRAAGGADVGEGSGVGFGASSSSDGVTAEFALSESGHGFAIVGYIRPDAHQEDQEF
jgi:hypothetical protein